MESGKQVYDYRLPQYIIIGVLLTGVSVFFVWLISNATVSNGDITVNGRPATSSELEMIPYIIPLFVSPFLLIGITSFLKFLNERIEWSGSKITWFDKFGRVKSFCYESELKQLNRPRMRSTASKMFELLSTKGSIKFYKDISGRLDLVSRIVKIVGSEDTIEFRGPPPERVWPGKEKYDYKSAQYFFASLLLIAFGIAFAFLGGDYIPAIVIGVLVFIGGCAFFSAFLNHKICISEGVITIYGATGKVKSRTLLTDLRFIEEESDEGTYSAMIYTKDDHITVTSAMRDYDGFVRSMRELLKD